jgi:hypothetical protein
MDWQADARQASDEWEIQRLGLLYARAMDRNQPEIIDEIFTEDGVIDRAGQVREGRETLRGIPPWLKERYLATLHKVHNQLVTVRGDQARGETYCTAEHLERDRGGGTTLYSMSIRYDDELVRQEGRWRYRRRTLSIEWTDVRQVVWQSTGG